MGPRPRRSEGAGAHSVAAGPGEPRNFGDCEPAGEGLSEIRIDVGPGYRVYFVREGHDVYRLLVGGNKSTQQRDIEEAKSMALKLKQERNR